MNNKEKLEKSKNERLNEENYNTFGTLMKIVEYKNADDIIVEFQDEYKTKIGTTYKWFKNGSVKNPYDKTVHGIGYLGKGKYKRKDYKKIYDTWGDMLRRCYDPYFINKNLAYKDCFVCEEWHNFQNFAEWWEENVYNCNNERMHLDKDILVKGNKIYSPQTCLIVPQIINQLFVKPRIKNNLPIGVGLFNNKKTGQNYLVSRCTVNGHPKTLGYSSLDKPFQAFTIYKRFKESYIKQIADEYKNLIPQKLYDALYKYEVEIND